MKLFKKYFLILVLLTAVGSLILTKLQFKEMRDMTSLKIMNRRSKEKNCGRMPRETDVKFDKTIWQVFDTTNGVFTLLNAYFDDREGQAVRVALVGENLSMDTNTIFCHFWTDDNPDSFPFVVEATKFLSMWPETDENLNDKMLPFLITCPINFNEIPIAVSLVEHSCDSAENKLKIINNQPEAGKLKKNFGVCCAFLPKEGPGQVINFIEWMEVLKILGADKVTTFKTMPYGALEKSVEHYQKTDFLDITEFTEPSALRIAPQKRVLELMQYTDCLYRTRNLYEFLLVLDSDEVLVPVRAEDKTWLDLTSKFNKSNDISSYMSLNVIFANAGLPPDASIPAYFYMLQQTTRFAKTNGLVKSFIDPSRVVTLYEHFAQFCLGEDWCNFETLSPESSLVFKYKSNEVSNVTMEDKTILKYKDPLMAAVATVLKEIDFKP